MRFSGLFQFTHPLRGATATVEAYSSATVFQSTHPLRGATRSRTSPYRRKKRFQSTHPLRGATLAVLISVARAADFNPRTPCGVRRPCRCIPPSMKRFQSTHPLRGATFRSHLQRPKRNISIHAPLAGCDHSRAENRPQGKGISIHAPLAGCDTSISARPTSPCNFNPRTPCGVRRHQPDDLLHHLSISIHAPLAGCDRARGAEPVPARISIHAPLAGCDPRHDTIPSIRDISIHAPLAGCDKVQQNLLIHAVLFQSTHPLRGATPGYAKS